MAGDELNYYQVLGFDRQVDKDYSMDAFVNRKYYSI